MPRYVVIEKREAETPLQALRRLRRERPELADTKMAYAGRLDPMASGKLLVLLGDECKRQDAYHGLDKEYAFEVLLNFSSDTGDVLGMPAASARPADTTRCEANWAARSLEGDIVLPYPLYSSKPVDGTPLFQYAHEGRGADIELPTARTRMYRCRCEGVRTVPVGELIDTIQGRIAQLDVSENEARGGNNFRRDEISRAWEVLRSIETRAATLLNCRATVSAGTYIRSFAPRIAEELGATGLAYSIRRTRIGRYVPVAGGAGLWTRMY